MPGLRLISATPSPYARKVRIALQEKKIPFELVTEVPWMSSTQTPLYNPLEKLPVLLIPEADKLTGDGDGLQTTALCNNETAVFESHFILEWLEAKYPAPEYWSSYPADVDGKLKAKQVEVVADGMCDALVLRFFEVQREDQKQSSEWIDRQMRKVNGGCRWLEQQLGDNEFMVGNQFSLADIATGAVLGYLAVRFREYPWPERHPKLARYLDRLSERQSFKDTVPYPQKITEKVV